MKPVQQMDELEAGRQVHGRAYIRLTVLQIKLKYASIIQGRFQTQPPQALILLSSQVQQPPQSPSQEARELSASWTLVPPHLHSSASHFKASGP